MHNTIDQELDELEETLSLCDLPLYSDQSADFDQDLSFISSSPQDYNFEFISQEFNPSSAASASAAGPPENIIFCGRLIPYKQPPQTNTKIHTIKKRKTYLPFLRWKVPEALKKGTSTNEKIYNTGKRGKRQDDKVPVFTSSPSGKRKWYFFMFGVSRLSPVADMRDIKNRQRCRRRTPAAAVDAAPPVFEWGLWGLIRALSCGGNHLPAAVPVVSVDGYASPE